jgi:hypothetical protein
MIHALILTDNTYNSSNDTISRGWGAHRIATHLRNNGFNVEVVDYCLRYTLAEFQLLCSKLVGPDTVFLGVGTNLFLDRDSFNELTHWFKKTYPHVAIVLGGNQLLSRSIKPVDYAIEGNAENAVLTLIRYLKGSITEADVEWTETDSPFKLINALKNYNSVDTTDLSIKYLPQDFIQSSESLGLETARGCIFKCSFCSYPLIGKKKLDYTRGVDNLVDELTRNYEQWGTTRYIINEDTFNDRLEKLETLHEALQRLPFKINFTAYSRIDLIITQPKSVELLRDMGMKGVHFGIETFNHRAAKLIGKGLDPDRIKDGLLWWREQMPDVITSTSLIVGLPYDDDDHFATADWYTKHRAVNYWGWQPLWLNNLEKSLHSSEFSLNYRMYGLAPMTQDEIDHEILIDLEAGGQPHYQSGSHPGHKNKITYWKNVSTGDNWFKAMRKAIQLNNYSNQRRVSCWSAFDWAGLGYSLEDIFHWGWHNVVPHVPEKELQQRATKHIEQYKKLKFEFDYKKYYQTNNCQ